MPVAARRSLVVELDLAAFQANVLLRRGVRPVEAIARVQLELPLGVTARRRGVAGAGIWRRAARVVRMVLAHPAAQTHRRPSSWREGSR